MPMGKRYETTVPQQALFLMNSPLVIEQVRSVVNREDFKAKDSERIGSVISTNCFSSVCRRMRKFRTARNSSPRSAAAPRTDTTEVAPSTPVVFGQESQSRSSRTESGTSPAPVHRPLTGWQEYAHALLLTNEASFVN